MTPERWQQVYDLFQSALEREPAQRAAFLDEACGGDQELRKEVEELISSHQEMDSFIDSPAFEAATQLLEEDKPALTVGQSVGRYKILSLLGKGGMGEVYLAQESKLGRKVALKLLPASFTKDEERVRRFEQEARAASALNHPNILTVHDIEEVDGLHFIITEYVEGTTLRDHLAERKLQLIEVLDLANQVASALSAAHQVGIVHRDIKPENIMLRSDGYVKVLDFGVAKLIEREATISTTESRRFAAVKTDTGVVIGSASYMSPEQAKGQQVDQRSDVFSFGVVLYELLTRQKAFQRDSDVDTLHAIIHDEPAGLYGLRAEFPPRVARVLRRCLRKQPDERYCAASELIVALEELGFARSSLEFRSWAVLQRGWWIAAAGLAWFVTAMVGRDRRLVARRKQAFATLALAVLAIVLTALAVSRFVSAGRPVPLTNKSSGIAAPYTAMRPTKLTDSGNAAWTAISRDGEYVGYFVEEENRHWSLWIRQVATGESRQISSLEAGYYNRLSFSHDGEHLYYGRGTDENESSALYRIPISGGVPTLLLTGGRDFALSPDDTQVAFLRVTGSGDESSLVIANTDGDGEKILATRKLSTDRFWFPAWSPDGKTIACPVGTMALSGQHMNVVAVSVEDGSQRNITAQPWVKIAELKWLADGSGLIMIAVDKLQGTGQIWHLSYPDGETRRITDDANDYSYPVSLSADSRKLVTLQTAFTENVWIAPVSAIPARLGRRRFFVDASRARWIVKGGWDGLTWMPDGRIVYASLAGGHQDIWTANADGTEQRQLTAGTGANSNNHPKVSPDGRHIVFTSDRTGATHLWRIDADGKNAFQLTNGTGENEATFMPDSKSLVYESIDDGTLWKVSLDGGEPVQVTKTKALGPAVSPDGKWLAYNFRDPQTSKWKVAIVSFGDGEPHRIFNRPSGDVWTFRLCWTPDGAALTYEVKQEDVSNIWLQRLSGGEPLRITQFMSQAIFDFELSPDGQYLVYSSGLWHSDVAMLSAQD